MSETRTGHNPPQRQKRSFLGGCLSHLVVTATVIALLIGGGYLWLNRYLQQYAGDIPTREVTQINTSELSSIDVTLNRESLNHLVGQMLADMPENPYDFQISWEDDKLVGEAIIEYNGMNLPAKLSANVQVAEGDYFQIVIDSINVAEIPLPRETSYDLIASQLTLPDWLIFHQDEPILDVDFSRMPFEFDGIELTASEANLADNELIVTVHYDPNSTSLANLMPFN